jgi:hypothetical protein
MELYDLEVRQGDETIAIERSIEASTPRALWSRIGELANSLYAPGRTIRVMNRGGEIVIMIGVAAALATTRRRPRRIGS